MKTFLIASLMSLAFGTDVYAAAAPVYPLTPSPTWCTSAPISVGQTKGLTLGPCSSPPVTGCTRPGRITVANIKYPNVPPSSAIRRNVDTTKYENIWGHASTVDSPMLYPGRNGANPAVQWNGVGSYIAAEFVAPANGSQYVTMSYSTYYSGPDLLMTVSEQCGDPSPAHAYCKSVASTGESFYKIVSVPYLNGCPIVPGRHYFVNLFAPVTAPLNMFIATNISIGTQP